jgi:hypothetical protein
MTNRKPTLSLLYSNASQSSWARALSSLIDESLASLCMQQWQRAPITVSHTRVATPLRRRTAR